MASSGPIDVLLYGLGGIGSFYAFILSRSEKVRLSVVARSNYDAVKAKGLTLNSENHGSHHVTPYQVYRTPAEANKAFDYVVCAHKALDQAGAAEQLAPVIDQAKTTIVILQNGVGNEVPFRERYPEVTVVSGVVWVGAAQIEPGVVNHTKSEDLQIGLYPNEHHDASQEAQRLEEFASFLRDGKTVFQVVPNVQVQRWEKVVWNVAWNSLTTLTLMTTHDWLSSSEDSTPMTRRLMTEVINVAKKCDVPLDDALPDRLIEKILAMHAIGSSMQLDYKNGRPMEVDIILGYPVKKGRELGVSIPTLETIYTILRAVNLRITREFELKAKV